MKAYQASGHQKTFNFTLCLYCSIYTQPLRKSTAGIYGPSERCSSGKMQVDTSKTNSI